MNNWEYILVRMLDSVNSFPYPAKEAILCFFCGQLGVPKDIVSSIVTVQEAVEPHGLDCFLL